MLLLLAASVGCSTVTIRDKGKGKLGTDPTYEDSKAYYLFRIVGEHHLDVRAVCHGKSPREIQTETTFVDGLLSVITIGIYTPRTTKIWCSS